MATEDLVRMANQIAMFFSPYPEDEAIEGVSDHLRKFWTPAMRRELVVFVESDETSVHALVVQTVRQWNSGSSS